MRQSRADTNTQQVGPPLVLGDIPVGTLLQVQQPSREHQRGYSLERTARQSAGQDHASKGRDSPARWAGVRRRRRPRDRRPQRLPTQCPQRQPAPRSSWPAPRKHSTQQKAHNAEFISDAAQTDLSLSVLRRRGVRRGHVVRGRNRSARTACTTPSGTQNQSCPMRTAESSYPLAG